MEILIQTKKNLTISSASIFPDGKGKTVVFIGDKANSNFDRRSNYVE